MNEDHVEAVAMALWEFDQKSRPWRDSSAAVRGYYKAKARVAIKALSVAAS